MIALEARIKALERAKAQALPLYVFTMTDGSRRTLDALDAAIYLAQLDAGMVQPYSKVQHARGCLPPGRIWETLEADLTAHAIRAGPD